jgi:hypothetical protein
LEHFAAGSLGHLELDIAAVATTCALILISLFQACHSPILGRLGRRQRPKEMAEVVGECMKLEPHRERRTFGTTVAST